MLTRLWMRTCALRAPEGDADGEGDAGGSGGGDGGKPKPKTFTQEDLNRIAAKEKKDAARAAREAADAEWQAKLEEIQKQNEELRKEKMTASERAEAERKEREAAEKRTRDEQEAKRKEQLANEKKRADLAEEKWRADRRNAALSSALLGAKVIGEFADDAAVLMLGKSKIDVSDDGEITSVIYGGKTYDTLADAARQFLQDKPNFAQAMGAGGAGTRSSNGGGGRGKTPLHEMSREQLMAMDRDKRAASGRK